MNQVIQILLSVSVLLIPIVFFWIYMTKLKKRTKRIIQTFSDSSSESFTDLKVWFKNFDIFKKNNMFSSNPHQTLYSFNKCDLILNDKNFMVIGKTRVLGMNKLLLPTIFEFERSGSTMNFPNVAIQCIHNMGSDLEIEFSGNNYKEIMTLVIKTPAIELKEKIRKRATTAHIPYSEIIINSSFDF